MVPSGDVRVFSDELALLYELIAGSEHVETGGELLGLWSHQGNPTIMLVSGPDDAAKRTPTHFMQPPDVHMAIERHMWERFGLQVLGIWHSHHRLGLDELSNGDRKRTKRYASTHGRARYVEFLGYIDESGKPRIRPYVYSDAAQLEEVPAQIIELPGRSPVRTALRRDPPATALHTSLLIRPGWPSGSAGTDSGEVAESAADPSDRYELGELGELDEMEELDELAELEGHVDPTLEFGAEPAPQPVQPHGGETGTRSASRFAPGLEPGSDAEDDWLAREILGEAAAARPVEHKRPARARTRATRATDPSPWEERPRDGGNPSADTVATLERSLARLPASATHLVRLTVGESGYLLTLDPLQQHASLFFPVDAPQVIEFRTESSHPMVYRAHPGQRLEDFYFEHVAGLVELAIPFRRVAARSKPRRAS